MECTTKDVFTMKTSHIYLLDKENALILNNFHHFLFYFKRFALNTNLAR